MLELTKKRNNVLILITILSFIIVFSLPAISQPQSYHIFADRRQLLGIKNCLNVVSNLGFVLSGVFGIVAIINKTNKGMFNDQNAYMEYLAFFISSVLVGLGSSYYHLNPNNNTMFWDRLPMNLMFMSVFCGILYEFVNKNFRYFTFLLFITLGIISVIHWEYSEMIGRGDLRFYAWSQTYPFLMIVLILLLYPSKYTDKNLLFIAIFFYMLAKAAEFLDQGIYSLTMHLVSGHSIKHILAAIGVCFIARYIAIRRNFYL